MFRIRDLVDVGMHVAAFGFLIWLLLALFGVI